MGIRMNSTNTYTGEFTGWESSWSVVFQGYGQFKIWRILTKIRSQSCVFIWCYSLLIYFTFQLQQGQNSTTSEKGAQSKQNDQLLISPWKFLGCRSIMFWPNHFFFTFLTILIIKTFPKRASASNVDELIIFRLILFKSVLCVISYISSSYQTSIARKFKSTLKWKWHHKCAK